MIAARLCSAEGCGALVYSERRWCPTHRPCREPPPRTIIHRLIRLIQKDPTLTNWQLMERLDVYPQQIVEARRITGIPDPGDDASLLPWSIAPCLRPGLAQRRPAGASQWRRSVADHADTCVVERCSHRRIPGWPWCEDHRPRFDREPVRTPVPQSPTDRVREAVRRFADWEDEAIAAYAGVSRDYVAVVRRRMGRHRRVFERTLVQS